MGEAGGDTVGEAEGESWGDEKVRENLGERGW